MIEYPVMSGGKTISVATVLLETGIPPMQEPVTELVLEAPPGWPRPTWTPCAGITGSVRARMSRTAAVARTCCG